jgi:putative ABC transport system substrate-binding protein
LKIAIKRILQAILLGGVLLLSLGAYAQGPSLAVLYPDVREPYRSIFQSILDGIKDAANGKVRSFPLRKNDDPDMLNSWIAKNKPEVVISLGSLAKEFLPYLSPERKVVSGAALFSNSDIEQGMIGISLSPSPQKLFVKLKKLAPEVRRISVVYHPDSNGWLIDHAKQVAEEMGLVLAAMPAHGVREAARLYQQILAKQENGFDAIWLLQDDPTLDEIGLLPRLLSEAWNHEFIVFSSNPSHVKRGALFSLFPDNAQMGKSLARKAGLLAKGQSKNVEPLKDLLIAVNIRTADHLTLKISRAEQRDFDLIFPSK